GDTVNVRILEVDAERRRLSLSLKRVDDGMPLQPPIGEDAAPPTIDLSEDVFSDEANALGPEAVELEAVEPEVVEPEAVEPEAAEEVFAMTDHTRPPAPPTPVEVPPDKA